MNDTLRRWMGYPTEAPKAKSGVRVSHAPKNGVNQRHQEERKRHVAAMPDEFTNDDFARRWYDYSKSRHNALAAARKALRSAKAEGLVEIAVHQSGPFGVIYRKRVDVFGGE